MRILLLAAVLLTACSRHAPPPPPPPPGIRPGTFAAGDRDALCIGALGGVQRAGFVTYGAGNANCSVRGKLVSAKGHWLLEPGGDAACKIALTVTKDGISLGPVAPACAYYCAPGVSFAGKRFARDAHSGRRPADLGGDPLC